MRRSEPGSPRPYRAAGGLWLRREPRNPALWLVATPVVYLWAVSAAVSGLARYLAPAYGLLGLLAGVALLEARQKE